MPISDEHVGRCYSPTSPYQVTKEKIAEFAASLGDNNPAYQGQTPIAPPTFAALIAARAWAPFFNDPELGIALERTVHASQSFSFTRPLRCGDEVVATLAISKVRTRGQMELITIEVKIDTVENEHVVTATSQLVHHRQGTK